MGKIFAQVTIVNPFEEDKKIECSALVDTGSSHLVLPSAWKNRFGQLKDVRKKNMEGVEQRIIETEIAGPLQIQVERCGVIYQDICFVNMEPEDGDYEPLIGYLVLEASQLAVDMISHSLVPGKRLGLKKHRQNEFLV